MPKKIEISDLYNNRCTLECSNNAGLGALLQCAIENVEDELFKKRLVVAKRYYHKSDSWVPSQVLTFLFAGQSQPIIKVKIL